ncbi:MAG: hypothetical protein VX000_16275 [Myxococcota bacterium]|nr:hypothetical protein [Myxococcota bacterium]
MPGRNKGFDPLSSLFEAPEPGLAAPVPPGDMPRPTHADPGPAAGEADPDGGPADMDRAAIAKAVAAAAAARLQAQGVEAQPVLSGGSGSVPTTGSSSPPARKRSRLDTLAARAVRPRGDALAAARAAVARETRAAEASAEESRQAHQRRVSDQVAALVPTLLPEVPSVKVVNAIIVQQRDVLRALWTAHRARFITDGQLERAVGAAVVLQALDAVGVGGLVAAHVETPASDYLVWIDVERNQVLAAFPDARAYFSAA